MKLFDGVRVTTAEESEIVSSPVELWQMFGWDIEHDANAKECADIIMRELLCFGHMDLSQMNNGKTLYLSVIPCKEA